MNNQHFDDINNLRSSNRQINLVLFFTRGVSLHTWYQVGMLDREVALYKRLQKKRVNITFITYGDKKDFQYRQLIPGIKILINRWSLPQYIYEKLIPFLHFMELRKTAIFKTNQTNGADIALRTARIWKKPLIARCGYMFSLHTANEYGKDSPQYQHAKALEEKVFSYAQQIVVTSPKMQSDIEERLPQTRNKICVIPNYVSTDIFTPEIKRSKDFDLIFVGRLEDQKNLSNLLDAINSSGIKLLIIGSGSLKNKLQNKYGNMDGHLHWIDRVNNTQLPDYLNRAKIFILPSFYEGHPKTLIEAMACGMPVIGADSPGIREIINHGENGWLCGSDTESIQTAINYLLNNPELCEKLGHNAREFAVEHYALDKTVEMEIEMYNQVINSCVIK